MTTTGERERQINEDHYAGVRRVFDDYDANVRRIVRESSCPLSGIALGVCLGLIFWAFVVIACPSVR